MTVAEFDTTAVTDDAATLRKIVWSSVIGTAVEWYDFLIYGAATALVFNKVFFAAGDPALATIAAFGTYAVGFLARPLGAAIFGHFGDRVGRKAMLAITIMVMGLGTFLIGLLPTYQQIGVAAPILLVVLRFLQGIGLGGEWGGAVLMSLESGDPKKRGLNASWPQVGVPVGLLLANGVLALMQAITDKEAFLSWGWRIPFLLSGVLVIVGLWIRMTIAESPLYKGVEEKDHKAEAPIIDVLRRFPKQILLALGARVGVDIAFYIFVLFITTYITTFLKLPGSLALGAVLIAAAIQTVAIDLLCVV